MVHTGICPWIAEALPVRSARERWFARGTRTCDTLSTARAIAGNVSGIDWLRRSATRSPTDPAAFTGADRPRLPRADRHQAKGSIALYAEQMQKNSALSPAGRHGVHPPHLPQKAVFRCCINCLRTGRRRSSAIPDVYGKAVDYLTAIPFSPAAASAWLEAYKSPTKVWYGFLLFLPPRDVRARLRVPPASTRCRSRRACSYGGYPSAGVAVRSR
jgi:hypothetical protein